MNAQLRKVFALGLSILISTTIYTAPSLLILKGMSSTPANPTYGIKKEYSFLNPAIGALYWFSPFLKNIYEFGDDAWAFTQLVKQMFNINVDGSFDITNSYTKVANYFTPETMGKLIGLLSGCIVQIQQNPGTQQEVLKNLKKRINGDVLAPLVTAKTAEIKTEIIEGSERTIQRYLLQNPDIERPIRMAIKKLQIEATGKKGETLKVIKQKIESLKNKLSASSLTGEIGGLKSSIKDEKSQAFIANKNFNEDRESFAAQIKDALQEELNNKYPRGTLINSLLAFLWKKAQNINDLRTYLNAFASIQSKQPQEIYNWPDPMSEYTEKECSQLRNQTDFPPDLPLEDLIIARFAWEKYFGPFPQKIGMDGKTIYKNIAFPDCGESTLLNFFNIFSYNPTTKKFDTDFFEKLGFVHTDRPFDIYKFYNKYNSFDITREKIETPQAHNDWAEVVSELPGVIYSQGICDIRPGKANFLKVINQLCPAINSFEDFATLVHEKFNDISINVSEKETYDKRLVKFDIAKGAQKFTITLVFTSGHFDIEFPTGSLAELINIKNGSQLRNDLPSKILYISCLSLEAALATLPSIQELQPIPYFFINFEHDGVKRGVIENFINVEGTINVIAKIFRSTTPASREWSESFNNITQYLLEGKKYEELLNFFNKQNHPYTIAWIIRRIPDLGDPFYSWKFDRNILEAANPEYIFAEILTLLKKIVPQWDEVKQKQGNLSNYIDYLLSVQINPQQIPMDSLWGKSIFLDFIDILNDLKQDSASLEQTPLIKSLYMLNMPDFKKIEPFSDLLNNILLRRGPEKALNKSEQEFLSRLYATLIPQLYQILQTRRINADLFKTIVTLKVKDEPRKRELLEKLYQVLSLDNVVKQMPVIYTLQQIDFNTLDPEQRAFIWKLGVTYIRQLDDPHLASNEVKRIIEPFDKDKPDALLKKEFFNKLYSLLLRQEYLQDHPLLFINILDTTISKDLSHLENVPGEFAALLYKALSAPGVLTPIFQKMNGSDISDFINLIVTSDYANITPDKKRLLTFVASQFKQLGIIEKITAEANLLPIFLKLMQLKLVDTDPEKQEFINSLYGWASRQDVLNRLQHIDLSLIHSPDQANTLKELLYICVTDYPPEKETIKNKLCKALNSLDSIEKLAASSMWLIGVIIEEIIKIDVAKLKPEQKEFLKDLASKLSQLKLDPWKLNLLEQWMKKIT